MWLYEKLKIIRIKNVGKVGSKIWDVGLMVGVWEIGKKLMDICEKGVEEI